MESSKMFQKKLNSYEEHLNYQKASYETEI